MQNKRTLPKNRKTFVLALILIASGAVFEKSLAAAAFAEERLSLEAGEYIRLYSPHELRSAKRFNSDAVLYVPLIHEGGTKLKIVEVSDRAEHDGTGGSWCRVILALGFWNEPDSAWVEKGGEYWVWISDDAYVWRY